MAAMQAREAEARAAEEERREREVACEDRTCAALGRLRAAAERAVQRRSMREERGHVERRKRVIVESEGSEGESSGCA